MLSLAGTILQQQSWDNKLTRESTTRDIYQDFDGTFSDNKKMLPPGIIANVKLAASKNNHIVGLLKNISGPGVTGRESQLNKEKDQQVKEMNVFSNDVSQALNTERYGLDAHDKEAYRILEAVQPQLSFWHKEIKGKYIREAFLERYSSNLTVAPTTQVKRWNENILIKGVTFDAQPEYDATNADYETNITAAATAGTGGQWDVTYLNAIIHWTTAIKKIMPMDNGRYIVLGTYGPLDLYEDPRSPVVNVNGAALSSFYKGAGDDDDRYTAGGGTDYDVGFVHGKGGAFVATHENLHFEEELQNYAKVVGVGAFAGYGVTRTVFDDVGSETDTSEINQNSAVLLARTSLAAV